MEPKVFLSFGNAVINGAEVLGTLARANLARAILQTMALKCSH